MRAVRAVESVKHVLEIIFVSQGLRLICNAKATMFFPERLELYMDRSAFGRILDSIVKEDANQLPYRPLVAVHDKTILDL